MLIIQSWANPIVGSFPCFQSPASTALRKGGPSEMNTDFKRFKRLSPAVTSRLKISQIFKFERHLIHTLHSGRCWTWATSSISRTQMSCDEVAPRERTGRTSWRIVINMFFNGGSSAMFRYIPPPFIPSQDVQLVRHLALSTPPLMGWLFRSLQGHIAL